MRTKRSIKRLSETVTLPTFVAHGMHVGDNDENSIVWFGLQLVAVEEFHIRKLLRSPHLIFEMNILREQTQ
jgi:hypothetical protein